VSSCHTDVVQVIEPHTELGADERVGRGLHLSCDAVWLETEDTGSHEVDIVPPSSHDRVSLNAGGRHFGVCETSFKAYT